MSQTPQLVLQGTDWGNPLTYFNGNNWTLTWKNGRQLATATKTGTSVSYGYDLNGLRTSKKVGGVTHTYLYAGGQLQRETYISGRITRKLDFLYDQNGRPYALNYSNGTTTSLYYYVLNLQGDVIQLVGTDGNIAASYRYDPWGRVISATGSMANINPLRYRGYYYDTETGFYYLQSRYYDPTVCRFINADSYASTDTGFIGNNMFAYCNNNPITGYDPTGEILWEAAIICAAIGGISGALSALVTGGDATDIVLGAVFGLASGFVIGGTGGAIIGRVVGAGISAIGAGLDAAYNGASLTSTVACAGISFVTAFGAASLSALCGNDLLASSMVDSTFGFGASLCNAVATTAVVTGSQRHSNHTSTKLTNPAPARRRMHCGRAGRTGGRRGNRSQCFAELF